jgi:hypothetical protein
MAVLVALVAAMHVSSCLAPTQDMDGRDTACGRPGRDVDCGSNERIGTLGMNAPVPARLHVLLARKAKTAVITGRGPSKSPRQISIGMGCSHPGLDSAEGMLDCLAPLAHLLRVLVEPTLHRLVPCLDSRLAAQP